MNQDNDKYKINKLKYRKINDLFEDWMYRRLNNFGLVEKDLKN